MDREGGRTVHTQSGCRRECLWHQPPPALPLRLLVLQHMGRCNSSAGQVFSSQSVLGGRILTDKCSGLFYSKFLNLSKLTIKVKSLTHGKMHMYVSVCIHAHVYAHICKCTCIHVLMYVETIYWLVSACPLQSLFTLIYLYRESLTRPELTSSARLFAGQ